MNLIENLKKVNLSLKKAEIAGILYILSNTKDLTNNKLVQLTGLPKEELKRFKSSISNFLNESNDESISLNPMGEKEFKLLNLSPYSWSLLDYDDEYLSENLKSIREKYTIKQKREYDQWFATEESSVNKVKILDSKGCVKGNNILLIGDDDLVSVVLGLSKIEFAGTTVLDIDNNLLDTIKTISIDYKFKDINTHVYDVKKELDAKLLKKFDVVVIDPPYTELGVSLFLNRAIEALKGPGSYIFLYFGNSFKSPEKFLKIQEILGRAGLLIEDKIDKFSRYNGAESIGSASSVYVLKTTNATKLLPIYDLEKLYTFDVASDDRFPHLEHVTLRVSKVPKSIMKSKSTLHNLFNKFCAIHKLKAVDTKINDFKSDGSVFTFIFSNASMNVRVWPAFDALYIDIVTDQVLFKKHILYDSISKLFNTNHIHITHVE